MSSSRALSSTRYGLRHQVKELIDDRLSIRQVFLRIIGDENTRRCKACNYLFKLEESVTEDAEGKKVFGCPVCAAGSGQFQVEVGFTHGDSFLAEDEGVARGFLQLAANFISRMIVAAPAVGLTPVPSPGIVQPQVVEKKWWYAVVGAIVVCVVGLSLIASAWSVPTNTPMIVNGTSTIVTSSQPLWSGKDATTFALVGLILGICGLLLGPDFLQKLPGLKPESYQPQSWADWIQLKVGMGENKKTGENGCMRKYRGAMMVLRRIKDLSFREEVRLRFRPEFDAAFSEVMNRFDEAFRTTLAQLDTGIVDVSRPAARGTRRSTPQEEQQSS